jgi:hypothetical protein
LEGGSERRVENGERSHGIAVGDHLRRPHRPTRSFSDQKTAAQSGLESSPLAASRSVGVRAPTALLNPGRPDLFVLITLPMPMSAGPKYHVIILGKATGCLSGNVGSNWTSSQIQHNSGYARGGKHIAMPGSKHWSAGTYETSPLAATMLPSVWPTAYP